MIPPHALCKQSGATVQQYCKFCTEMAWSRRELFLIFLTVDVSSYRVCNNFKSGKKSRKGMSDKTDELETQREGWKKKRVTKQECFFSSIFIMYIFFQIMKNTGSVAHESHLLLKAIFFSSSCFRPEIYYRVARENLYQNFLPSPQILLSYWELAFIFCHFCASNVLIYQAPSFSFC